MGDEPKLNAKRAAFIREYLIDCNGKQAAIRAGYSPKTAEVQASQLLSNLKVQEAIKEAQSKVAEAAGISAVMVALEYKKLAFSDLTDFLEWDDGGIRLKPSAQLTDARRALAEVSESITESGRTRKIKVHDKKGALDSLCKMLGFNAAERQELTGKAGGPIEVSDVAAADARLAAIVARVAVRPASGGDS